MPRPVSAFVLMVFALEIISRGSDYMDNDPRINHSLSIMETAMPLPIWGAMCITSGVMVLAGMSMRRTVLIVWGAVLAMGIFGGLSAGAVAQMVNDGWPPDGWRIPGDYISRCVIWGALAWGSYIMSKARPVVSSGA